MHKMFETSSLYAYYSLKHCVQYARRTIASRELKKQCMYKQALHKLPDTATGRELLNR